MNRSVRPASALRGVALLSLVLALAFAPLSHAQDERASREREALRRAQAMLRDLQAERDTLRIERDNALAAKDEALAGAAGVQRTLAASRRDGGALKSEVEKMRQQLGDEQQRLAQAKQSLERAEAEAGRNQQEQAALLARLRAEINGIKQANTALVALLEQRTQALADAVKRNQALHALGLQAVELYRDKGTLESALQDEPVLGLTAVRIEDTAEQMRMRIDAQRLPK